MWTSTGLLAAVICQTGKRTKQAVVSRSQTSLAFPTLAAGARAAPSHGGGPWTGRNRLLPTAAPPKCVNCGRIRWQGFAETIPSWRFCIEWAFGTFEVPLCSTFSFATFGKTFTIFIRFQFISPILILHKNKHVCICVFLFAFLPDQKWTIHISLPTWYLSSTVPIFPQCRHTGPSDAWEMACGAAFACPSVIKNELYF